VDRADLAASSLDESRRYTLSFSKNNMSLFCVDIGNTNVVMGVYQGPELASHWRIATEHQKMADEYAMLILDLFERSHQEPSRVEGVIIASVVPPLTGIFEKLSRRYFRQTPLVVGAGVRTGVRIRYDAPQEVGADRIVNAVAACHRYGAPACIVDFGTATTFDALSAEGDYLGGAIAPGIGIAAEALFRRTAKLPRIDLVRPPAVIGKNTVHSMQSGLLFGYVGLVEGIVARFRAELGPEMKVIATGGLASLVAAETAAIDAVDPWLTLEGLRLIWEMNR
jgi:type III pantothenate kinase